jgi:hypothetical protein
MLATKRPTGTWRFIPPEDRKLKKEKQSVFVLSPLSQGERMSAWDNLKWVEQDVAGNRTVRSRAYQQALELALAHIEDVENFPAGKPEPWPRTGTLEEKAAYLDKMDDVSILVIGSEIRNHSSLEEEAKN